MTRTQARNDRDVRERLNTLAALVGAGVPRKYVASILGYKDRAAVNAIVSERKLPSASIHGRDRPQYIARRLGPRPCKSCLVELPAGHGFPRCVACDRAHHRSGDCACGYAIRVSAATCKRCGKERPEALRVKSKARQAALAEALVAEPTTPAKEIAARFGYKAKSAGFVALKQEGRSAAERWIAQKRAHMRHVRALAAERKRANTERRARRRATS